MEMEMISWTMYMIMDYQCMTINYLLQSLYVYMFWPYINWLSLVVQNSVKPKSFMNNEATMCMPSLFSLLGMRVWSS